MLQNLTKGKMVEWVVLLVALVALGLTIAAVAKPCSSNFADKIQMSPNGPPSGPTDCEVGGRVCCNDSEDCPTAPHGKKIPVYCDFSNGCSACPNQYEGVCSDGKPPCQSEEGDDCGTTEECCAGLTCSPAGFCVKTSLTKPGHLPGDGGNFPPPGFMGGGGTPSPPSSPPSPSPSPSPGGGKKSSDLPLILGITGGSVGAVILLVLVYLVMTKRLKL
jgi:hypothetical protein